MAKDITGLLGGVLTEENLESLSKQAGVSTDQVKSVLSSALPSLLGGALDQAQNEKTAKGFAGALNQHAGDDVTNVKSFLQGVDVQDGEKIVGHLLGSSTGDLEDQIAAQAGVRKLDVSKILALVAPLLMSLLGQETQSQQQQNTGLDVGSIMGGLLGGGLLGGSTSSQQSGNAGGDLLTGLLGGGSSASSNSSSSGGLLSGLLGGLFGGK